MKLLKSKPETLGDCMACGNPIPRGSAAAVVVGITEPRPDGGDNKVRVCDVECAQALRTAAAAMRSCLGCGQSFTPKKGEDYCTRACERATQARMAAVWTGARDDTLPGSPEALTEALTEVRWLLSLLDSGRLPDVPRPAHHLLTARRTELAAIVDATRVYAGTRPPGAGIAYARGTDGSRMAIRLGGAGEQLAAFLGRAAS